MQAQITESTPQEVAAGTSTTLKIQGKNLIGATVKFGVPGIDSSPYLTKPKSVDLPVRVGANVPPGEVVLELTTPLGKTQGTFQVTALKIGNGSPVRREGIGKHQTISTTAPTSCPEGMVGVAAETGGFCIEIDRSYSGDVRKAEKSCAMAGKRLCQAVEWQHACEQAKSNGLGLKNITGEWEWTGSYAKYDVQVQTGERDLSDELKSVLLGRDTGSGSRFCPGGPTSTPPKDPPLRSAPAHPIWRTSLSPPTPRSYSSRQGRWTSPARTRFAIQ